MAKPFLTFSCMPSLRRVAASAPVAARGILTRINPEGKAPRQLANDRGGQRTGVGRGADEFDSAFAAMMRERPDAFTMKPTLRLHGPPSDGSSISWRGTVIPAANLEGPKLSSTA